MIVLLVLVTAAILDHAFGVRPSAEPAGLSVTADRPKTLALKEVQARLVLPDIGAAIGQARTMARESLRPRLHKATTALTFFDNRRWMRAPAQPKCWHVPWQRVCTIARHAVRLNQAVVQVAEWRLEHELATTNDWRTAVRITQGPYPGTDGWLLSCSASEGSWGEWVPNREGSGVGGWMQMFPSTFWRMYNAAVADLRSRGFVIPESSASWYSPLGQALASAWGVTHGRRGEWAGSGC